MNSEELERIESDWILSSSMSDFISQIESRGWNQLCPISIKYVFVNDKFSDVVLKFDCSDKEWKNERVSSTSYEHRQFTRARPRKKKYIPRSVYHNHGLLIQERLDETCDHHFCQCADVKKIAERLRILDWHNHGWKNGKLKFFDSDSYGSGWYNWKRNKG